MIRLPAARAAKVAAPSVVASALRSSFKRVDKELTRFRREPEEATTHDLRVAIRRLASALELARELDASPEAQAVERPVKRLQQALSPLRDLEILRAALAKHGVDSDMTGALEKRLRRRERELQRVLERRIERFPVERASAAVSLSVSALEAGAEDRSASATLVVLGVLARRYWTFARRRHAFRNGSLADIHRVRVAFKKYRYALEIGAPLLRPLGKQAQSSLKQFQDLLGSLQDSAVIVDFFASARRTRSLVPKLELEQQKLLALVHEILTAHDAARVPEFSQFLR